MKHYILFFLLLIPAFLFAQYPNTGNKSRLGYQTTGDGLIWRGVAADTVLKPRVIAHAYFQLDTVDGVLRRYIATNGSWQVVGGGSDTDSTVYATRYWTGQNFFPLTGGTLTGTTGNGFLGLRAQSSTPSASASGFRMFANGAHNLAIIDRNGWITTFDISTSANRDFTYPSTGGTFALGTGITDRSARWSGTNTLAAGNITDNGTKLQALLPWQFQSWPTPGRPTGTDGYYGKNTTTGFLEGYYTSQWENLITSTGASNGQVSVFSSAGKTYGTNNFFWDNSNARIGIGTTTPEQKISIVGTASALQFKTNSNNTGVFGVYFNHSLGSTNPAKLIANAAGAFGRSTVSLWISSGGDAVAGDANWTADYLQTTFNKPIVYTQDVFTIGDNIQTAGDEVDYRFAHGPASSVYIRSKALGAFNRGDLGFYTLDSLRMYISGFGGNVNVGQSEVTNYKFSVLGTNAIGLPRGTVAQRPTIVSSTTPFRYNTDSTALEYGESVGTWRQLATRSYARSILDGNGIISALPLGNVSIATNTNTLTLNGSSLILQNQGGFNSITVRGSTGYEGTMIYGQRRFQYFSQLDDRFAVFGGHYNWKQAFTWTPLVAGIPIAVDVFSLDTVNTRSRRVIGDQFGSLPFTMQVIAAANISGITAFEILKSNSGSSAGSLFGVKSSNDAVFDNKFNANGTLELSLYGDGVMEAADLSKTQSNYIAGFATDGTVLDLERKRDTTIFVTADTDYDFSAAATTAQIFSRYNRVIIHMTLTSGAGADKTVTLHSPDANLAQCEILIRGTDNTGTYDNEINFGTNNAISSDGTNTSGYTLAQGQGLHVRVVYNGSAYKYIYY